MNRSQARVPRPPFEDLERSVEAALEVYANVHRGMGHYSVASTQILERARAQALAQWGWNPAEHTVVFGSPYGLGRWVASLDPACFRSITSRALGLPLGIWAVGVERRALRAGPSTLTGGGTVKLVSPNHVLYAGAPDRLEAGTPAVIHALACVRAWSLARRWSPSGPIRSSDNILFADVPERLRGEALLEALRKTRLGRDRRVPTAEGLRPFVQFDHAASTGTFGPIWQTVRRVWRQPEAVHEAVVARVRDILAHFLGAPLCEYETLFVANTTEALNLAARTLPAASDVEPVVLTTSSEHHSNDLPWRNLRGVSLLRLAVGSDGLVDPARVELVLREYNDARHHGAKRITWLAVSGASNVLGVCNDLTALGGLAHRFGAHLLVDGAQLVAHRPVEMARSGIDALAFSGHKAYAPFGSGALVVRRQLLRGTDPEIAEARRSGEENVVGIAALGTALTLLDRLGMPFVEAVERETTQRLLRGLTALPQVEVFGPSQPGDAGMAHRIGVVSFAVRHVPHNLVGQELADLGGIGARTGCFCAHLLVKALLRVGPIRSYAGDLGMLLAPKVVAPVLPGLVRLSLGLENTQAEVDHCLRTLARIVTAPRPWLQRALGSTHSGMPAFRRTNPSAYTDNFANSAVIRVFETTRPRGTNMHPTAATATATATASDPQASLRVVTGATGFLGSHFLVRLLARGLPVAAIVRGRTLEDAESRLRTQAAVAAASYEADVDRAAWTRLVRVMTGDICKPQCGIEDDVVQRIARRGVSEFWHLAASLRHEDRHAEDIALHNLGGTRHALQLAARLGCEQFVYVSTAYTAGVRCGDIPEELHPWEGPFNNHYEQSKCRAEHEVVRFCEQQGIAWTILRPSIVVGPFSTRHPGGSGTGLYGVARELYRVRKPMRAWGKPLLVAGDPATPLNTIPVDWVVDDMMGLAEDGFRLARRIHHQTSDSCLDIRTCASVIAEIVDSPPLGFVCEPPNPRSAFEQLVDQRMSFYRAYLQHPKRFRRALPPHNGLDREQLAAYIARYYQEQLGRRIAPSA